MGHVLAIDDIVFACTNLCDLLEVENEGLERHDYLPMKDLAESKAALARLYEQSVHPMTEDPSLADELDPDLREELLLLGARLQELVEQNAMLLKANIEANQMLMDAMVNAAKTQATNTIAYGNHGSFDLAGTAEHNSISFNKTL